jgi:hypothetical protein
LIDLGNDKIHAGVHQHLAEMFVAVKARGMADVADRARPVDEQLGSRRLAKDGFVHPVDRHACARLAFRFAVTDGINAYVASWAA